MEEKDKSLFKYNGKTYKLIKQPKEGKSCGEFCSLHNLGCEKLCVKAYNELDNPDFGLIDAVFVEVDELENKETGMKENEIDYKKLYEEEHKKYEGALERARGHHSVASHYSNADEIQELEHIFPELKDSEDENKMMKGKLREILRLCYAGSNCSICTSDYEKLLAWLEKQGEKNPTDKIKKPKFKVGDWCIDYDDSTVFQIVKVLHNTYTYRTSAGEEYSSTHYMLEDDARLWTIQDAKDGDVLVAKIDIEPNDFIYIFKRYEHYGFSSHCYLDAYINKFHKGIYHNNYNVGVPASKEQRDLLFQKMKEAGYEWDAEDKVLKKIGQNSTWSEEDEIKESLSRFLVTFNNGCYSKPKEEAIDSWLSWIGKQKRPGATTD